MTTCAQEDLKMRFFRSMWLSPTQMDTLRCTICGVRAREANFRNLYKVYRSYRDPAIMFVSCQSHADGGEDALLKKYICRCYAILRSEPTTIFYATDMHLTEMGKAALFPISGVKKAISQ